MPLSPEQLENAMKYGVCRVCGAPREARMTESTANDGTPVYTYGIHCPNGHTQWERLCQSH